MNGGDSDGEGIGGTGIHDGEGLGGTGIIGVISDVDTFTVNGQNIEIDERTTVEIDGKIGSQSDLKPGQLAMVEAEGPSSSLRAKNIFIRYEIVGPVTKIGAAADEFIVLDQHVDIADDVQRPTSLNVGDWVAVSGFRISNGRIQGTRIERRDPARAVQVYGRYDLNRNDKVQPVRIANMTVDGLPPEQALVGREVLLRAQYKKGRLSASKIVPQGGLPFDTQPEKLSITAYVDSQSDEIEPFGLTLVDNADDAQSIASSDRKTGRLVAIEGRLSAAADELEIEQVRSLDDPYHQSPEGKDEENEEQSRQSEADETPAEVDVPSQSDNSPPPQSVDEDARKEAEKQAKENDKQAEKDQKEAEKQAKENDKQAEKDRKEAEKQAKKGK